MVFVELGLSVGSLCEIVVDFDLSIILNLGLSLGSESEGFLIMLLGMIMKNFNLVCYVGCWYEVVLLKLGFVG